MSVVLDGLFNNNDTYDYDEDYQYHDEVEPSHGKALWVTALYLLVLLVGLLGNGLLLVALAQRRGSWSVSDVFVLHLSLADVLLLLTLPLWAAQTTQGYGWRFGVELCRISGAVFNVNFFFGIFILICFSLYLYLSIIHAKKVCSHQNACVAHMVCVLVLIVSLLLTIPDWIYLAVENSHSKGHSLCVPNYHLPERHLASRVRHHTVDVVTTLLICCLCVLLWLHGAKCARRRRGVFVVVILVAVFLVCRLPFSITLLVDTLRSSSEAVKASDGNSLKMALIVTSAWGCTHACLRPLLYYCLCRNFREWTLAALRCDKVECQGSLWELGVGEEALPDQSQQKEELRQMTSTASGAISTVARQE